MTAEHELPYSVDAAIDDVKRILDETRNPKFFGDVDHSYEDKYALAEYVVNVGLASQLNCLEVSLGLDAAKLATLMALSKQGKRSVTLRFTATDTCSFLRQEEVELNSAGIKIKKKGHKMPGMHKMSSQSKVVATVIAMDYYWKLDTQYKIIAFIGSDPTEAFVVLKEGQFGGEISQRGTKSSPRPKTTQVGPHDAGITHLLKLLKFCSASAVGDDSGGSSSNTSSTAACSFVIDREAKTCRTPWNNKDVEDVRQKLIKNLAGWSTMVSAYFVMYATTLPQHRQDGNLSPPSIRLEKETQTASIRIFNPVLPFFESNVKVDENDYAPTQQRQAIGLAQVSSESSYFKAPVLTADDTASLLCEHRRSLLEVQTFLKTNKGSVIETLGANEVFLCAAMDHLELLGEYISQGVFSIELSLRDQLIAAVGKHIGPTDFAEYMRFHNRRFLKPEYAPTPFCYSVRRPDHYPEGTLSIMSNSNITDGESGSLGVFDTLSHKLTMSDDMPKMSIPINAATNVQVGGERYVHAILAHEFDNTMNQQMPDPIKNASTIQLVARARQFSCFMLVLGTVTGSDTFDPSSAIILQNKEEIIIPLLLEQLPSPKEFKDAIQSLSPEQQRFAKAFRNMQLATSVFGVMVIQLKPQLEKLLKLPTDALTKEVKLTQSLLELFMEYQIPSDLLTYDNQSVDDGFVDVDVNASLNASTVDKVNIVKGYVKSVEDMIGDAKEKTIADETSKAEMRHARHFSETSSENDNYGIMLRCAPTPQEVAHPVKKHRARSATSRKSLFTSASNRNPYTVELSCAMRDSEPLAEASAHNISPYAVRSRLVPDSEAGGQCDEEFVIDKCALLEQLGDVSGSERPLFSSNSKKSMRPAKHNAPASTEADSSTSTRNKPVEQDDSDMPPANTTMLDFSSLPKTLDARFEQFDEDSALRATKVKPGPVWTKKFRKNILSKEESTLLSSEEQQHEKDKAFDLLDALSRSGSLDIDCAELHVVVAATHCFDLSLIDTVIHDNINPIEKFERSVLIVTSVLHGDNKKPADLIATPQEAQRIMSLSPKLLLTAGTTSSGTES